MNALSDLLEQNLVIRSLVFYALLLARDENVDELNWRHDVSNDGDAWCPFAFREGKQIGEWVPPGTFISALPVVLGESFEFVDGRLADWNIVLGIAHGTLRMEATPSVHDMKELRMRWTSPLPRFVAKALLAKWDADPRLCDFT